jgi:hypothetical protein
MNLADRFRENAFDIAGLADLPEDPDTLQQALVRVRTWLKASGDLPATDQNLADILFALIRVAQEEYNGAYFPHFEQRLNAVELTSARQSQLGGWFRAGLSRFDYFVPREGLSNVTPIVFHAGVPRYSVRGLVHFMRRQLKAFTPTEFESLDPSLIQQLIDEYADSALHQNVRRVLRSCLRGVGQIWASLARVLTSWDNEDERTDALNQLPAAIDREEVILAMQDVLSAPTAPALPRPRLTYDSQSGMVQLWLPAGARDDWHIRSETELRLFWDKLPKRTSVEIASPLPESLIIEPRNPEFGGRREFLPRVRDFPGFWFRASDGQLIEAPTLVRSGLESGQCFLVARGEPADPDQACSRRPLNWPASAGWGAWAVDVPERGPGQIDFSWRCDGSIFTLPLERKPRPRLTVQSVPAASAIVPTLGLANVPVYGAPLEVVLRQQYGGSTVLLRRRGFSGPATRLSLAAGEVDRIAVSEPGLYQLRDTRAGGQILLEFAFIPALHVSPMENTTDGRVAWALETADGGQLLAHDGIEAAEVEQGEGNTWRLSASTIPPLASARWHWPQAAVPDILLQWSVPGVRWRLCNMPEARGDWSRAPIQVHGEEVARHKAELEIQVLPGETAALNGLNVPLKPVPAGEGGTVSLLPHVPRGQVKLACGGQTYVPVIFSQRPCLDRLTVLVEGDQLRVQWEPATVTDGVVLLAWDPLRPDHEPTVIRLTPEQAAAGMWTGARSSLKSPGASHISLTLAAPAGPDASAQSLEVALDRASLQKAQVSLVHVGATDTVPDEWPEPAHLLIVNLLGRPPCLDFDPRRWLKKLEAGGDLHLAQLFDFAARLRRLAVGNVPAALLGQVEASLAEFGADGSNWLLLLRSFGKLPVEEAQRSFLDWFDRGVHLGWIKPSRLVVVPPEGLEPFPCPLGYYRDLWLIGSTAAEAATDLAREDVPLPIRFASLQKEAAYRVCAFHEKAGFPWPGYLLCWPTRQPDWRDGTLETNASAGHPRHYLGRVSVEGAAAPSPEQFARELGLNGILTVHAHGPKKSRFRLEYTPGGPGWRFFQCRDGQPDYSPCCVPGDVRIPAPAWTPERLALALDLGGLLQRWGDETMRQGKPSPWPPAGVSDERLRGDPGCGGLYSRGADSLATDRVCNLWRIAWTDRLTVWRGLTKVFGYHGLFPGDQRPTFLHMLADALRRWPHLMGRCLALVELACRCLFSHGLGLITDPVLRRGV